MVDGVKERSCAADSAGRAGPSRVLDDTSSRGAGPFGLADMAMTRSGPSPVDRARAGSKHHVIIDGGGVPLAVTLTGANRDDVT